MVILKNKKINPLEGGCLPPQRIYLPMYVFVGENEVFVGKLVVWKQIN